MKAPYHIRSPVYGARSPPGYASFAKYSVGKRAIPDDLGEAEVADSAQIVQRRQSSYTASTSQQAQEAAHSKPCDDYRNLFASLEHVASSQVSEVLESLTELTEPYVAFEVARTLPPGDALFVGNSMPIRDIDAFGGGQKVAEKMASCMATADQGLGVPIAANRGASGIDGIISTAAGYAFGLKRAVTLLIGDVSFLHDINGLNLLRTGGMQPPLTIVLVNNGGGGIFDFLPIAEEVPEETFIQLWTTPQNVDLAGICRAHGLAHQRVTMPQEMGPALAAARGLNKHSIVEVLTNRKRNVAEHRRIQESVAQAVVKALTDSTTSRGVHIELTAASYQCYSLPLKKAVTSGDESLERKGMVVQLHINSADGKLGVGLGEVAPLKGLHKESRLEAEQQLALLCQILPGCPIPSYLLHETGGFEQWLKDVVGILDVQALLPSVVCGLEGALVSAVASLQGVPMHAVLKPSHEWICNSVPLNALHDCSGSCEECIHQAVQLIRHSGCQAIKIKVGRREDPGIDAKIVRGIRDAVGGHVVLRADANRRWSLSDALRFAKGASSAKLQYLEEPLADPAQLYDFCQKSELPVAFDETLDERVRDEGLSGLEALATTLGNVAAFIVKPAVIGGFSRSMDVAKMASKLGVRVVVSSAFETKLALSQYAHLAAAVDCQPGFSGGEASHGLSTSDWFADNITGANFSRSDSSQAEIQLNRAQQIIAGPMERLNLGDESENRPHPPPARLSISVECQGATIDFSVLHWASPKRATTKLNSGGSSAVLFLHGFLGRGEDWNAIAAGLRLQADCYAVDLPGHGQSTVDAWERFKANPSSIAKALCTLMTKLGLSSATAVVAYSLGSRIATHLLAELPKGACPKAVLLSGTAMNEGSSGQGRADLDNKRGEMLQKEGLEGFLREWYKAPMWAPLVRNPRFQRIMEGRKKGDAAALAKVVSACSPVREEVPLTRLQRVSTNFLIVAGELDAKYIQAGKHLQSCLDERIKSASPEVGVAPCKFSVVKGAGHALHLESPEVVMKLIHHFL